jgi:hypothetical protein
MLHSTDIIYLINIYLWTCSTSHMFCLVIYGMLNKLKLKSLKQTVCKALFCQATNRAGMSKSFTLSNRSNLLSVLIAFHCFCIKIALGDVNLCFSLILLLLNKDKHTTKDDCETNKNAHELRQLTEDTLPPSLVLHQELCTV